MKQVDNTNTVTQRPLFPKGRPHLIAVSKSVEAKRAVPPILSHAGIDPAKTCFVEATVGDRVTDIQENITPDTEVIVIWNLPALVRYKLRSDQRVLKVMRELLELAINRRIAVIGVTDATGRDDGREGVAGSVMWIKIGRTVAIVGPGSTPDTITACVHGPNLASQELELALSDDQTCSPAR
jgi:hypothetical protein